MPQKGAVAKSDTATYKVTNADFKNGTVSYTGPIDKNETAVTVPDEVVIDGVAFKVTSIEKNAFKGNKKIKQVTIGKNAFNGCKKMTSATIGKSVSKIGAKAYKSMLIKNGVNKKAKFKKG